MSDATRPRFDRYIPTQGWVYDIATSGNDVWLPTGWYGLVHATLDALP